MKPFLYKYGALSANKLSITPPHPSASWWIMKMTKNFILFKMSGDTANKIWNITFVNLINLHRENAFNHNLKSGCIIIVNKSNFTLPET